MQPQQDTDNWEQKQNRRNIIGTRTLRSRGGEVWCFAKYDSVLLTKVRLLIIHLQSLAISTNGFLTLMQDTEIHVLLIHASMTQTVKCGKLFIHTVLAKVIYIYT